MISKKLSLYSINKKVMKVKMLSSESKLQSQESRIRYPMNLVKANLRRRVESQCIVGIEPTLTRTIPASFKSSTKDLETTTT